MTLVLLLKSSIWAFFLLIKCRQVVSMLFCFVFLCICFWFSAVWSQWFILQPLNTKFCFVFFLSFLFFFWGNLWKEVREVSFGKHMWKKMTDLDRAKNTGVFASGISCWYNCPIVTHYNTREPSKDGDHTWFPLQLMRMMPSMPIFLWMPNSQQFCINEYIHWNE